VTARKAMNWPFEQYDVILSPTLASLPVPIGQFMDGDIGEKLGAFMANTSMFNQTGQPSISLPLAWSESGLPIGMMLSAAFGNDALLFQLAGQIEQARPWADRRAPHHANAAAYLGQTIQSSFNE